MKTAVVFGGYGVFGSQVARALVERHVPVIVAGRDRRRAEAFAREIGANGIEADALNPPPDLLTPDYIVVNCAGPFSTMGSRLLETCASRGVHHVDIADDRGYIAAARTLGPRFTRSTAVFGCSSLPAISLALLNVINEHRIEAESPARVRVTLFIGNNNPKGAAAIRSLIGQIGGPFPAPQGTLYGFRNGETIDLPFFGRRRTYDFNCADYDLIIARSISVKVGFELGAAMRTFALMARIGARWGEHTARFLSRVAAGSGSSGGVVQVEVFEADGYVWSASLAGASDGQRMAALPAALAVHELARGREATGALTAPDLLGARTMLDAITQEGFTLTEHVSRPAQEGR